MEILLAALNSLTALIIAITGLVASLTYLVTAFRKFRKLQEKDGDQRMIQKSRMKFALAVIVLCFATGIITIQAYTASLPPNVKMTNLAWEAFNKGQNDQAIKHAKKCIDEFQPAAQRQQTELKQKNVQLPPEGAVSPEQKKEIMSRGLLNDVATCWWIVGRSNEKLDRKEEAIQAYCSASVFTYARTYDSSWNGFWSPAQSARDRLNALKGECK